MSDQYSMILKSVEILCRTATDMGDATVDGLLDIMP